MKGLHLKRKQNRRKDQLPRQTQLKNGGKIGLKFIFTSKYVNLCC